MGVLTYVSIDVSSIKFIDVPPTVDEDFLTKPTAHRSFRQLIGVGTSHVRTRPHAPGAIGNYIFIPLALVMLVLSLKE